MAQDKTSTPVNSQKKAMDLYLAAKAAEAAERDFGKTYIEPLGPGEEIEYSRPGVVADPGSWLNRGLVQLGNNAIDVTLGHPTGNTLVDMGTANVPAVGAATILAAGGMPGLIDVAGLGDLKAGAKGLYHLLARPYTKGGVSPKAGFVNPFTGEDLPRRYENTKEMGAGIDYQALMRKLDDEDPERKLSYATRMSHRRLYGLDMLPPGVKEELKADAEIVGQKKAAEMLEAGTIDSKKVPRVRKEAARAYVTKKMGEILDISKILHPKEKEFVKVRSKWDEADEATKKSILKDARDAYRNAYDNAIASGKTAESATEIAIKAKTKSIGDNIRAIGGNQQQAYRAHNRDYSHNYAAAFSKLNPEQRLAIMEEARQVGEEARQAALAEGKSQEEANKAYINNLISTRKHRTVEEFTRQGRMAEMRGKLVPERVEYGEARADMPMAADVEVDWDQEWFERELAAEREMAEQAEAEFQRMYAEELERENAEAVADAIVTEPEPVAEPARRLTKKEKKARRKAAELRNEQERLAAQARREASSQERREAALEARGPAAVLQTGWRPSEHVPELTGSYPSYIDNDLDRRRYYVADSLAGDVLRSFTSYNPNTGARLSDVAGRSRDPRALRHEGTNYTHELWPEFYRKLFETAEEGIHDIPVIYGESVPVGGLDIYDMVFRRPVDRRIMRELSRPRR